jgi:hypothetical protein
MRIKPIALIALVVMVVAGGAAIAADTAAAPKTHDVTTEVVAVDLQAKTMTIKAPDGNKTVPVADSALASIRTLKAGDQVVVTCLDDEKGAHQKVTAVKLAPKVEKK